MSNDQSELNGSKSVEHPPVTKSSSYLENLNLNKNDANADTDEDAEEIPSTRKRGANKIYEEKLFEIFFDRTLKYF
jgi:hypothetical protein